MQKIGDLVKAPEKPAIPKNGGVNSPFNNAVDHVVQFMGEPKKFAYWCGRLRKLPPQEIFGLISRAKEGRNPKALFNFLLKKKLSTDTLH